MKKYLIILILFILALLLFSFNKKISLLKYKLNNKTYKLLTAKNPTEWERGLMFYKSKQELKGADGMIFIFPDKDYRSFWNENTYLDLDIYWLDGDKVLGKFFLQSINKNKEVITVDSPGKVDKVIEIVK